MSPYKLGGAYSSTHSPPFNRLLTTVNYLPKFASNSIESRRVKAVDKRQRKQDLSLTRPGHCNTSRLPGQVYTLDLRFKAVSRLLLACTVILLGTSIFLSKPETAEETMNAATNVAMTTGQLRPVAKIVKGQKMMEGAGVQICRTLGVNDLRVDPYLMLDELKMPAHEATAGFPDHPHRGFETCSIMLSGKMEHRDSVGNHGVIGPGGVQWMTAGRGIIHSEMPAVTEGDLHGFQLWINLPAKDKMVKPRYQDVQAEEIPVANDQPGSSVRVMAGSSGGLTGPLKLRNPGMLLDVRIEKDTEWKHHVPEDWNGFAYVYHGNGSLSSGTKVGEQHAYIFETAKGKDHVVAKAGKEGLKFLLIAGRPINEPIVQYGPFVMNSPLEIQQAFHDYRTGRLQNPNDNPWVEGDEL